MTTTIVYPSAGVGGSDIDGVIRRSGVSESWATLRAGAGNNTTESETSANAVQLTATTTTDVFSVLRRAIITADTSAVPTTDDVSAFTLSLYGNGKSNGVGTFDLDVVSSNPATTNDLVNADFTTLGTSPYGSVSYASFSTSAYNDITCDVSAVAKGAGAITKLGLRLSCDTDNTAPTWASGAVSAFTIYFADQTGTTNDPKLTIVHAAAASDTRIFIVS